MFSLLLCLLASNSNSQRIAIQDLHSYVQVLVNQNELTSGTAAMIFSSMHAIATDTTSHPTNPPTHQPSASLNITVNDVVRTIQISTSNPVDLERRAARFCIATGISAPQCVGVRDSLVDLAITSSLANTMVPQEHETVPALVTSPSATLWQFTQQRVYFNVSLQFQDLNPSETMCYHIDFDTSPKLCGDASTLISELAYLPRPSFTRAAFQPGWHTFAVQPYSFHYSSDFRFFYVAEPTVHVVSASTQCTTPNSCLISARVQMNDFRPNVDGEYCMLVDWQIVSCSLTKSSTTSTLMNVKQIDVGSDSNAIQKQPKETMLDVSATITFRQRNRKIQTVSFILMSKAHHSKAVAVSEAYLFVPDVTSPSAQMATADHYIDASAALSHLSQSEWGKWSQNGEDGVLLWIFSELGMLDYSFQNQKKNNNKQHTSVATTPRYFVEFGVEDGYECNTRFLREEFGWTGLLMDGSHTNETLNLQQEFITAEDINLLFQKYNVPTDLDFLSIDIDFNDFWVLKSILNQGIYSAKVIAVEYNSHVPYNESRTILYNATQGWDGFSDFSGAGAGAFAALASKYGYRLVFCESHGVNLFLIRQDLLVSSSSTIPVKDIHRGPNFFGKGLSYPHGNGTWVYV